MRLRFFLSQLKIIFYAQKRSIIPIPNAKTRLFLYKLKFICNIYSKEQNFTIKIIINSFLYDRKNSKLLNMPIIYMNVDNKISFSISIIFTSFCSYNYSLFFLEVAIIFYYITM